MTDTDTDRVADATPDNWVYSFLPKSVWPYAQLARWDRPIGWWLLLWPCWWSLALAVGYSFDLLNRHPNSFESLSGIEIFVLPKLFFFLLGSVAMRGAGCTYNDIVDVQIDQQVERTASRPIPSGRVNKKQAAVFTVIQALVGFICLLYLCWLGQLKFNTFAFLLAISSLAVVACYPFAKRITNWPQFVLGLAFSWGALMGWAVVFGELATASILLYIGCVLWTIGYDTIYAHQDREDDALVGVRSTARLFGKKTKPALMVLYAGTLVLFGLSFSYAQASWPSFLGLFIGSGHMLWQIKTLDINDGGNCLKLFKSNSHFGWIVFVGLIADIFI